MSPEHTKRINTVINHILQNPAEELPLEKLAVIANYSPFHFQKIFKRATGESPKQFIIRIRLENSAFYLIAHRNKSITEIALSSGFASPATFSRAFKNYFGIAAEEMRNLSPKEQIKFRHSENFRKYHVGHNVTMKFDKKYWEKNLKVSVRNVATKHIVFVNTPLSDIKQISQGFRKIIQLAEAHDILTKETVFTGVIKPHAGLYQAAVTFQPYHSIPKDINTSIINSGKFVTAEVHGDIHNIFHTFHAIHEFWLPESPYRIKESFAFEILSQNPITHNYPDIDREIFIPVEPV